MRKRSWALDVALTVLAVYRVVVAYSVDVAMAFRYPLSLKGCAVECASRLCEFNCRLRAAMHLDMSDYVNSGVDPVSAALDWPIRLMTGFYFVGVAPFMVLLVYCLWRQRDFIRKPAIAMGLIIAAMMTALILKNALGHPPSTNLGLFLVYNALDVALPILILLRVVPKQ